MNQSLWQETVREDTHIEDIGPYNRHEGGIRAKKGEGLSIVKGRERRDV